MSGYDPFAELATMPLVSLRWQPLDGRLGEYRHPTREIVLDPRMRHRQRRCTLAHEIQHAVRQDEPCATPVLERRQELIVERAAARRLISLDDLAEALRWARGRHELAELLDVDLGMLDARLSSLRPDERAALQRRLGQVLGADDRSVAGR